MMFKITPEAESEIDVAADWYEHQTAGLAVRFYDELESAYEVIARQPQIFSRVSPRGSRREYRQFVLWHCSYSVIYEIDPPDLVVIAVTHNQRRPFYWRHRRAP
jgi:toxin ParE2